jgi:hypothetical protein
LCDPQPNSAVRSVDDPRDPIRRQIDAILRLQASAWDDKARVGYIWPIRLNLGFDIGAIFSGRRLDDCSLERSEYKRDHRCPKDRIAGRGLRGVGWVHNQVSRKGVPPRSPAVGARPNAVRSPLGPSRRPNRRWACRAAARARSPGWGSGLGGRRSRPAFWTPRTNAVLLSLSVA